MSGGGRGGGEGGEGGGERGGGRGREGERGEMVCFEWVFLYFLN